MKKIRSLLIIALMLMLLMVALNYAAAPAPAPQVSARPASARLLLNGAEVVCGAYNIGGNNYFALRDIAGMLSGGAKQFSVADIKPLNAVFLRGGKPYKKAGALSAPGQEEKKARLSDTKIYLNGQEVPFVVYNVAGANYFRLRDIGEALDFAVFWDEEANSIALDTAQPYPPPVPPPAYSKQGNLLALMYHDLSLKAPREPEQIALATTAAKLAADIEVLLELGYRPLSLEDYYDGLALPGQKYFVITFDDGYAGVYDIAYPVLRDKQAPAAIFFNSGMEQEPTFLKFEQLREMEASGLVKAYTHLSYHMRATQLSIEEFRRDLDVSVRLLQERLGEKTMFMAYPYGDYNRETYRLTREYGIPLQLTQEQLFPADDILVRVNVPYDADMRKLVKGAVHN